MDVEKLKKINQLSKELKKHGMAMEEAIEQASDSVHENEIKEFLHKSKEEMESTKNPSSTEQYIIMMERNNRKIMEEVQKVKQEVSKIIHEFSEIKKQFEQMPETLRETSPRKAIETQSKLTPKTEQKQSFRTAPKKKAKNPRQGDYTSDDVSIEKMFYFGKK
ncbi:hypothetical protein JW851_02650 [Candidatus Woesearchaeota archaeon]|nr:hypothetical protein [Candidatus Woesearchaeota archaeon]